jgi:hypothetical protein
MYLHVYTLFGPLPPSSHPIPAPQLPFYSPYRMHFCIPMTW